MTSDTTKIIESLAELEAVPQVTHGSRPPDSGTAEAASGDAADAANPAADVPDQQEEKYIELLGKLPPEIGTMLIIVGAAGIVFPGPFGTPLLLAGAVSLWPKTFAPMERFFAKRCPGIHRQGVAQIRRYITDLNRRYPDN